MPEPATKDDIERLTTLMQDNFARIEQRFDEVNARFDVQDGRLGRHGALLQTGSRWSAKMNDWAEKVDALLAEKDRQIANLSDRVRKLEDNRQ